MQWWLAVFLLHGELQGRPGIAGRSTGGRVPEPRMLPVVGTRVGRVYVPAWPGGGRSLPEEPSGDAPAVQRWIAWRLLAGNGWEIARSAMVFPDRATCRTAITALKDALPGAEWTTSRGVRPDAWSWELTTDGLVAAVASRYYKLQRECESAVRTFLTVLPTAVLPNDWATSRSDVGAAEAIDERAAANG